jgi:hypothetical protein
MLSVREGRGFMNTPSGFLDEVDYSVYCPVELRFG